MEPPTLFSMGSTAVSASHCVSAWNATSNCSHGSGSAPGQALRAALSLYAPGTPWYATRCAAPAGAWICARARTCMHAAFRCRRIRCMQDYIAPLRISMRARMQM
jgi:hypothetical protein